MKKLLLIIIFFISYSVYCQNEKAERNAYHLEIAADETRQYAMDVKQSAYFVKDKVLQIYCGEEILVECEIENDTIKSMKVVEKNINPNKTITINFNQNTEDRKQIKTDLLVKNPFQKKLLYDAFMFTPKSQQWKSTSIIPIKPTLQNYEMWPHSIITLVLQNWRLE